MTKGRDLISVRARLSLRELLVGATLGIIDHEFESAEVARDATFVPAVGGQRRYLVEQYYRTLDFESPADARKFLDVCESYLARTPDPATNQLVEHLSRDGYAFANGRFSSPHHALQDLGTGGLSVLGVPAVDEMWRRMFDRCAEDPAGAITAARTLIETVSKHILEDLGEVPDENADLPALYKAVSTKLNLAPDQHTEPVFRQILGGCATVVNGLAGVRNKLSDAHGKGSRAARPSRRHAEFAVNVAGSVAAFLVATWAHRTSKPA